MSRVDAFRVEGIIVEVLPNRVYRAELTNGHRLLAFVPGKLKAICNRLAVGDTVRLQLSSYDLSQGRILVESPSEPKVKMSGEAGCPVAERK